MKAADVNLLDEGQWHGVFFAPGSINDRFLGVLRYSPADGITLDYTQIGSEPPTIGSIVHGILSDGESVTLFRHDAALQPGLTISNGVMTRS